MDMCIFCIYFIICRSTETSYEPKPVISLFVIPVHRLPENTIMNSNPNRRIMLILIKRDRTMSPVSISYFKSCLTLSKLALCCITKALEALSIADGDLGKHLSVDVDLSKLKTVHELAV